MQVSKSALGPCDLALIFLDVELDENLIPPAWLDLDTDIASLPLPDSPMNLTSMGMGYTQNGRSVSPRLNVVTMTLTQGSGFTGTSRGSGGGIGTCGGMTVGYEATQFCAVGAAFLGGASTTLSASGNYYGTVRNSTISLYYTCISICYTVLYYIMLHSFIII